MAVWLSEALIRHAFMPKFGIWLAALAARLDEGVSRCLDSRAASC